MTLIHISFSELLPKLIEHKERVREYFLELDCDYRYSRVGKYDNAIFRVGRELGYCDEWDWHLSSDDRYREAKELLNYINS